MCINRFIIKLSLLPFQFYPEIKSVSCFLMEFYFSVFGFPQRFTVSFFVFPIVVGKSSGGDHLLCICLYFSLTLKSGLAGCRCVLDFVPSAYSLCPPSYVWMAMLLLRAPLRSYWSILESPHHFCCCQDYLCDCLKHRAWVSFPTCIVSQHVATN